MSQRSELLNYRVMKFYVLNFFSDYFGVNLDFLMKHGTHLPLKEIFCCIFFNIASGARVVMHYIILKRIVVRRGKIMFETLIAF